MGVTLSSATSDTAHFSGGSFCSAQCTSALAGGDNPEGPSLDHAFYITKYFYDALGNLICVEQHGNATGTPCPTVPFAPTSTPVQPDPNNPWRLRRFAYNSLGQMVWASNPESGVISYLYDLDGNVTQKTSPQANQIGSATTSIGYCYDKLNRLLAKGYSNSPALPQQCSAQKPYLPIPAVVNTFDEGTNGIGQLTSLTDQAGSGIYAYDIMGRIKTEQRVIAGKTKTMSYVYNLAGFPITLTYPSTRVVNYTPDAAGRVISAIDANGTQYAASGNYDASGSLAGFVNGSSITNSFLYNPRLQLCRITAFTTGSVSPSCTDPGVHGNLIDKGYNFNLGASDNGNVLGITNYRDNSRSESFTYDLLNRILSGSSQGSTGALAWGENYAIDPWSNLQMSPMAGKPHGGNFPCAGDNLNRATCLSYDSAGNVTANGAIHYSYDQENRLLSTSGTTYTYDADGNRVEKSSGGTGTLYWYGTPGIVAESDLGGNLKSEYVFFAGKRVARIDLPAGSVHYYLSDHLGSTSMVVSPFGATEEESDYSPYGTEFSATAPGSNHYKFTGKERDTESCDTGPCLDYFGDRHYSSSLGRFLEADEPFNDQVKSDPQSWNLYNYVRNNPINRIDPDGRDCVVQSRTGSNSESVEVTTGTCAGVTVGDGQTATFVPGTVTSITTGADNASIDIHYTPYEGGSSAAVQNANAAPIPDRPGIAYGYNAQGYKTLALASRVTNTYVGIPLLTFFSFALPEALLAGGPELTTLGILDSAAEALPDLTGLSKEAAREVLEKNGFKYRGTTKGGYEKWYHPDGSRVQIRPNGEVVRTGPKSGGYRPRIDQGGNQTSSHNTGEKLK